MIRQTVFGFKIEKTEETLTAHGGLALLAEYNHGMGLRTLADRHLPGPGSNRGYAASAFVDSLVLLLQAGGRRLEDLRELRREGPLLKLVEREDIPDSDTVGDWLRRMGDPKSSQDGLVGLGAVRDVLTHRLLRRDKRNDYTLDVDAMQVEGEKHDANFTYLGVKGYMPMLGYLFESGICVNDEFREGNESPGAGHVAFYLDCVQRMPAGKRIARFRADSASYQAELINELEGDSVLWTITADQDSAVKKLIANIPEAAWKEAFPGAGYELAETVHSMEKTKQSFRLVVKREERRQQNLFDGGKYFHYAVATNLPEEKSALDVLAWHNQRGQAENYHKELKSGFGQDQMPCGQSHANAVYFRIGVIAYNLFLGFRRLACPEAWGRHTIATFRWKLIQIAGRVVRHAGQIVLKLRVATDLLAIIQGIRQRCSEESLAAT
jgi:Transposase DDE domain group 1